MSVTFWGLFVACAMVVAAYVIWMLRVERREESEPDGVDEAAGADGPGLDAGP